MDNKGTNYQRQMDQFPESGKESVWFVLTLTEMPDYEKEK